MRSKATVSHLPVRAPDRGRPGAAATTERDQWAVARRLRALRRASLRRRFRETFFQRLAALTAALWRWQKRRKTYYELLTLSDSQLKDIGLRREQLAAVAADLARATRTPTAQPVSLVASQRSDPAAADVGDLERAA